MSESKEQYDNLSEDKKIILIRKTLISVSDSMESMGYPMIGFLLGEAVDRISSGNTTTG